jgi:signal transduction histidine kinase/ActR/RegA family two-component response regulator
LLGPKRSRRNADHTIFDHSQCSPSEICMSSDTPRFVPFHRNWVPFLLWFLSLAGLFAVAQYNFLLFHVLAEAYTIIIAIAVYVIFWNTRHLLQNGLYLVVGFGCLFGGIFDIIYVLAHPGMPLFPQVGGNLALQAKTVAQWYVSLSCVGAFAYMHRMLDQTRALLLYGATALIALAAIYWRVFPDCYREGVGITAFERFGLVISCSAYLVALGLLIRTRHEFDGRVFRVLAATLITFFVQDAVSALAVDLDDWARIVAHMCQVVAISFVYKAFVEVGLRKPYDLLFRRLQRSAEEIRQINKTLQQRAEQLRALASELTLTEQRERRRLAQVLHDSLQQILVAAKMQVKRAKRRTWDDALVRSLDGIDDLLDQSIAESRSLTLELSPPVLFDRGLVGGLEWLARHFFEKHQLMVALDLDPKADPARETARIFLFQAARELLFNVVKHTQAQSALISLTRLAEDRLRLAVADDGQGFDPARAEREQTLSGFGLFSIRERLELMGGRMEIVSEPGHGTEMIIELPAEPSAAEFIVPTASAGPAAEPRSSPRMRVMLADDHPVVRKGLADLLREQAQIDVVAEAQDGQEAMELALQTQPDVVLMDITMPRLTGIEATRQITTKLPAVRVIGLSMHEDEDMARAMREAGAVAYVTKSEAADQLVATVLSQANSASESPSPFP